ncbi:hypothetical protein [Sphingomonas sp.]|uniref:hypothetical protein n=1 Tax=Sphingomonas sp. TaxID=28214 RepID=UPI00185EB311|nr:hypothetical protein [Sphingomonas sp.]MBA3512585.1 hypothetical protein [Sphingomonas sp.]
MLLAISSAPPEKIDLTVPQPCVATGSTNGEIVVCARRNDGQSPYRIEPTPSARSDIPKAEVQLGNGVVLSAETETHYISDFPSKRAMVRLKIKF